MLKRAKVDAAKGLYSRRCLANRVLLLDKALRYQKAVDCLTSWIVWDIGQTGKIMSDKQMACRRKAKQYRSKISKLYEQALEIQTYTTISVEIDERNNTSDFGKKKEFDGEKQ